MGVYPENIILRLCMHDLAGVGTWVGTDDLRNTK